LFSKK